MYCDRCNIKFGSQEKRVIQHGKTYHLWCRKPAVITYTQEGGGNEPAVQHLLDPQDRGTLSPRLGAG